MFVYEFNQSQFDIIWFQNNFESLLSGIPMVPDFLLHLVDGYLCRIPVGCACLCPYLVTKVPISLIYGEIYLTDDLPVNVRLC